LALILVSPSCKKITHDTNPTPTNVRLTGYTVITTPTTLAHTSLPVQTVTTNYSFIYNSANKISQIYYTTNDSNIVQRAVSHGKTISTFTYSGNTITKVTSLVTIDSVLERDTFTTNASGQIMTANFPFMSFSYSYYGQLLIHENLTYRDTGTTVSASATYTSSSGDFLTRTFDGNLHATFPNTGIRPVVIFPDTVRDSVLSLPLTVTWTSFTPVPVVVTHNNVNSYSDQLGGYSENLVTVNAIDPNHISARPVTFPADIGANKTYTFYGDQNRPGDFMQLGSIVIYGTNIYANANLVNTITSPGFTIAASYKIDADSKVTQATVVSTDKFGNVITSVYNLQYAAY